MKTSQTYFEITDGSDIVRVEIIGTVDNPAYPGWSNKLLDANVTVKGCTLGGQFSAEFMAIEFDKFKEQLTLILDHTDTSATFKSHMGYLNLQFQAIDHELFEIQVTACDVPGSGSQLSFKIYLEKFEVQLLIDRLDRLLEYYPAI